MWLMPEGAHRSSEACRFMLVLFCSCGLPRCRDAPHAPHRFWHLSATLPRLLPDDMRVSVATRGGNLRKETVHPEPLLYCQLIVTCRSHFKRCVVTVRGEHSRRATVNSCWEALVRPALYLMKCSGVGGASSLFGQTTASTPGE